MKIENMTIVRITINDTPTLSWEKQSSLQILRHNFSRKEQSTRFDLRYIFIYGL